MSPVRAGGREAEQVREGSEGPDKGVLPAAVVTGREVELCDDDRETRGSGGSQGPAALQPWRLVWRTD